MHFHSSSCGVWWDLEHFALYIGLFFVHWVWSALLCLALLHHFPDLLLLLRQWWSHGARYRLSDVMLDRRQQQHWWCPPAIFFLICLTISRGGCPVASGNLWFTASGTILCSGHIFKTFFCLHWSWPYEGWTKKRFHGVRAPYCP
jgi:hypothetical protein